MVRKIRNASEGGAFETILMKAGASICLPDLGQMVAELPFCREDAEDAV
jgi:hypothetical protein